jgi:hypothetical protein
MLKNDLIRRNPLRFIGGSDSDLITAGEFGAILARAGVGKTALLVQLAMDAMLRERHVLHISLSDPVDKVNVWYHEVYRNLTRDDDGAQAKFLWESLQSYRFIMTFKVEGFRLPVLEERLADLKEQGIFAPSVIIIDGYPFEDNSRAALEELKTFAGDNGIHVWFTVRTHRHEEPHKNGIPSQLNGLDDLFQVLVQLQPKGKAIHVDVVKGVSPAPEDTGLVLDPTTMLVADRRAG